MDIKIAFSLISAALGTMAFLPYSIDILKQKTKPHSYTWLIWTITQTTAVAGIIHGGGGWGALNLTIGTFLVFLIFLFSLKFGSKDITKSDTIILIVALLAILVWWQLDQPLIAIFMVSGIDALGYIPSFRKSYSEPWSETLSSWLLFSSSNIFALLALNEYNLLTTTYLITITTANISLFIFCLVRRRYVKKQKTTQQ